MYKAVQGIFQHCFAYLNDNISCLLYMLDLATQQTNWLTSYTNFLLDISEIFGAWLAVSVLMLSVITLLSYVHSISSFVWEKSKNKFKNSSNNTTVYRNLKTIVSLQNKYFK